MPIALKLTPGQADDGRSAADMLANIGKGQILLADRAYDSDAMRAELKNQGAWACVRPMPNRKKIPSFRSLLYHSKVKPDQAAFRADEAATAMIERMMLRYFRFDLDMPGYWRDQINSQGVNLVDKSPASSLYHILGCFAPLLDRKL